MKKHKLTNEESKLLKQFLEMNDKYNSCFIQAKILSASFFKKVQDRIGYKNLKINLDNLKYIEEVDDQA